MLLHRFNANALSLDKPKRTGVKGNNPDEWRDTVLMTSDRQVYIPESYVLRCTQLAARYTRSGRGTLLNKVTAALGVLRQAILVDRWVPDNVDQLVNAYDEAVYLDVRPVTNPGTDRKNIRRRVAVSPGWTASWDIYWENTIVSELEMQAVAIDAGRFEGVGDGRKIGCGRFEVTAFDPLPEGTNAEKTPAKGRLGTNEGKNLAA